MIKYEGNDLYTLYLNDKKIQLTAQEINEMLYDVHNSVEADGYQPFEIPTSEELLKKVEILEYEIFKLKEAVSDYRFTEDRTVETLTELLNEINQYWKTK